MDPNTTIKKLGSCPAIFSGRKRLINLAHFTEKAWQVIQTLCGQVGPVLQYRLDRTYFLVSLCVALCPLTLYSQKQLLVKESLHNSQESDCLNIYRKNSIYCNVVYNTIILYVVQLYHLQEINFINGKYSLCIMFFKA